MPYQIAAQTWTVCENQLIENGCLPLKIIRSFQKLPSLAIFFFPFGDFTELVIEMAIFKSSPSSGNIIYLTSSLQ